MYGLAIAIFVVALAALALGKRTPEQEIADPGYFSFGGRLAWRCSSRAQTMAVRSPTSFATRK